MKRYYVKLFKRKVPPTIDEDYNDILCIHSSYYRHLDARLKQRFRKRLYHLLNIMGFSSREFPVVTREMRAVIGASLIEITFGMPGYLPSRFVHVEVLPRRYMYPGYGEPFLGHIDFDSNTIYFSWKDVVDGFAIDDDAINVALHEMAHVFDAETRYRNIFRKFFARIEWEVWAQLAFQKMEVIRRGENEFLKDYGGHNMKEMFAVCIEAFFEQSELFAHHLPEIYMSLVDLLGQDPRNTENPLKKKNISQ